MKLLIKNEILFVPKTLYYLTSKVRLQSILKKRLCIENKMEVKYNNSIKVKALDKIVIKIEGSYN